MSDRYSPPEAAPPPGGGPPGGAPREVDAGLDEGAGAGEGAGADAGADARAGEEAGLDAGAGAGAGAGEEAGAAGEVDPLAAAERERDEYREALVRLQADFENYKKRIIKQQTDHLERAAQALVDKLLPVLDAADLAMAHGGGEDVKLLTGALAGVLEREGLERLDPLGTPFDPTVHEAVAHEPAGVEGATQEVVEVLRAGYLWKGRVLRPAMVKVRG